MRDTLRMLNGLVDAVSIRHCSCPLSFQCVATCSLCRWPCGFLHCSFVADSSPWSLACYSFASSLRCSCTFKYRLSQPDVTSLHVLSVVCRCRVIRTASSLNVPCVEISGNTLVCCPLSTITLFPVCVHLPGDQIRYSCVTHETSVAAAAFGFYSSTSAFYESIRFLCWFISFALLTVSKCC